MLLFVLSDAFLESLLHYYILFQDARQPHFLHLRAHNNQLFKFVLLFADAARRKRRIITQRWRQRGGHRGLEPANLAAVSGRAL